MPIKILKDKDVAEFKPNFAPTAIVSVKPGKIIASGKSTLNGKKVAVLGDEGSIKVKCDYTAPPFILKGNGIITITKVPPNLLTTKLKSGKKSVIKVGKGFVAEFEVKKKAEMPTPQGPKKDPVPKYIGTGEFKTSQSKVKAT